MGALRFFLAFSVALTHANYWSYRGTGGIASVESFFMLSGFLMAFVLNEKYAPNENKIFYTNRLLRIFGVYWACLTFVVGVTLYFDYGAVHVVRTLVEKLSVRSWVAIVLSNIMLIGTETHQLPVAGFINHAADMGTDGRPVLLDVMVIPQNWTLSLELYFYIIAPFIVRRRLSAITAVFGALIAFRITMEIIGYTSPPNDFHIFFYELPFFLMGVISYRSSSFLASQINGKVACVTLAGLVLSYSFWGARDGAYSWREIVLLCSLFVLLPSVYAATKNNRLDRAIGELSYPLYLVHIAFLSIPVGVWLFPSSLDGLVATNLGVGVAAAAAVAIAVDYPLNKFRQKRLPETQSLNNPSSCLEISPEEAGV